MSLETQAHDCPALGKQHGSVKGFTASIAHGYRPRRYYCTSDKAWNLPVLKSSKIVWFNFAPNADAAQQLFARGGSRSPLPTGTPMASPHVSPANRALATP
jgi:hypothetical protein